MQIPGLKKLSTNEVRRKKDMFCPAEGVKLSGAPVFKGGKDYEWMWLWRISPVRLTATFIATPKGVPKVQNPHYKTGTNLSGKRTECVRKLFSHHQRMEMAVYSVFP